MKMCEVMDFMHMVVLMMIVTIIRAVLESVARY